jgi:nucleotide-binding universal stress UspA family protein
MFTALYKWVLDCPISSVMKNEFSILEDSLSTPAVLPTPLARPVAVERKPPKYPAHRPLKILAPIDFSGDSKGAVEHAMEVAKTLEAKLSLVNVVEGPSSYPPSIALRELGLALPESIGRLVVNGPVPKTIAAYADCVDADLVLMTSASYRGWKYLWKPSVTAEVLASTSRPVLVTGASKEEFRFHCRKILCVLALDGTDGPTLRQAEALAHRSGGELMLFTVVPEVSEGLLNEVLSSGRRPFSTSLAMHRLREIGANLSVPYKTSTMIGSPHTSIGLAARQYAADIVVASRSGFDMRAIFRRLTCPLLSVRSAAPILISDKGGIHTREVRSGGVLWN